MRDNLVLRGAAGVLVVEMGRVQIARQGGKQRNVLCMQLALQAGRRTDRELVERDVLQYRRTQLSDLPGRIAHHRSARACPYSASNQRSLAASRCSVRKARVALMLSSRCASAACHGLSGAHRLRWALTAAASCARHRPADWPPWRTDSAPSASDGAI